jgi:alkylation response protein AidB-like acyl-CoA dehydrogenase
MDSKELELILSNLRKYAEKKLTNEFLLKLDHNDEFPTQVLKELYDPMKFGLHLVFIPEEYGGMGGGAYDVYRVSEAMAAIDLGIATGVLATFLGTDPIVVGGTEEQKALWMGRIAEEGLLVAYGATEPAAGSDLGSLKTKAEPVSTRFWPMPRAARPGLSWKRVPKVSPPTSRKTSMASAPATPRLSFWKTSTLTPTAWSAA